jgi:Sulfatase-modifying factor enzyme 1
LEEMTPLAIQLGQEQLLLTKTTQLLRELPSDSPDLERIGLLVNHLQEGCKNHQAAMDLAKKHREQGQPPLARNELAKAQAFLPNHPSIEKERLLQNYDASAALRTVLKQVRLAGGAPISFATSEEGVELYVDLANNRELKDLSFLKGQPITHLDLSNTGVSDLESIADLPLQVLHLDDTEVQDLRPLRCLGLRLLTAEGTVIKERGLVTKSIFLTNYRLGLPFQKTLAKTDRAHRRRVWVNHLGMRFSAVNGNDTLLMADWETRLGDFETFAEETKLPINPGMMCREESGDWKTLPFSWSDPPGEQSLVDPVVGVTVTEATRFCDWLTRKAREKSQIPPSAKFRLPTSAEWLQATGLTQENTAISKVLYPWGDEWPPPLTAGNYPRPANLQTASTAPRPFTTPVGRFRNLCAHRDMGGNVREWCLDNKSSPVLRDASCQEDTRDFTSPQEAFKVDAVSTLPPEARDSTVGFRVLLDFDPPR